MEKHILIRTIYLYLFSLLGLVLITIGAVSFVDMGLKAFIFTKAEEPERIARNGYYYSAPLPVMPMTGIEKAREDEKLTDEEITTIKQWVEDYKKWQETEAKIDYVTAQRHKDASRNLAFILIGLPLYLFHWRLIRKETENKE